MKIFQLHFFSLSISLFTLEVFSVPDMTINPESLVRDLCIVSPVLGLQYTMTSPIKSEKHGMKEVYILFLQYYQNNSNSTTSH